MSAEGVRDFTDEFVVDDAPTAVTEAEVARETDPHRLAQRQKQIDFGKNTLGYQRYTQEVPRDRRQKRHPRTPDIQQACSKRSFDGQVKKWRRMLHEWDPPGACNDAEQQPTSDSPQREELPSSKNRAAGRRLGGLQQKMTPSLAAHAGDKRSHAQALDSSGGALRLTTTAAAAISALISPPPRPADAKQARVQPGSANSTALELAATWKAMAVSMQASGSAAEAADDEELCYSDADDIEAMQMALAA